MKPDGHTGKLDAVHGFFFFESHVNAHRCFELIFVTGSFADLCCFGLQYHSTCLRTYATHAIQSGIKSQDSKVQIILPYLISILPFYTIKGDPAPEFAGR